MQPTTFSTFGRAEQFDRRKDQTMTPHDTAKALRAGANSLNVIHLDGDDYAYYAAETDRWYIVSRDEIVDLGRRLLAHEKDVYSCWCADGAGYEVSDLDHDTLNRIAQAGGRVELRGRKG